MRQRLSDIRLADEAARAFVSIPSAGPELVVAADPSDLLRANDLSRSMLAALDAMEREGVVEPMPETLRECRRGRAKLDELQRLVHVWAVRQLPGSAELQRHLSDAIGLSDRLIVRLEALDQRARDVRSAMQEAIRATRQAVATPPGSTSPFDLRAWVKASRGLASEDAGRRFDEYWAAYRAESDGGSN